MGDSYELSAAHARAEGDIVSQLIHAATSVMELDPEKIDAVDSEMQQQARNFLKAWWARKLPKLEMPNL